MPFLPHTLSLFAGFLLFALGQLTASYVYFFDEGSLSKHQQNELVSLILRGEPPRCFFDEKPLDLKGKCVQLVPEIRMEWIPTSLWQIAVLHAFFHDEVVQTLILGCARQGWDPLEYEEEIHQLLPTARSLAEIAECFDRHSQTIPGLSDLFFQTNKAVAALYRRSGGVDEDMLKLALLELPSFEEWKLRQFPFWKSPWIYNLHSAAIFYSALQDENTLSALLKIERLAHESGEWVLYRGFSGLSRPTTLQMDDIGSHALSFGSTLLGGAFFSLEAAALTYSKPETKDSSHSFLALRVTPEQLKDYFRIGPLHPLVQLVVNGELFHAHTKIAAKEYQNEELNGYFMESNRRCHDPVDYIITSKMTPVELEGSFRSLCEKSGTIFSNASQ